MEGSEPAASPCHRHRGRPQSPVPGDAATSLTVGHEEQGDAVSVPGPSPAGARPTHSRGPGAAPEPRTQRQPGLSPVTPPVGAAPGGERARPRRGLTLSEPSSGPSWQQSRHRKDLGSRHSVCRVLTKYVPPTFSRTHLEAAAAGGDSAPAGPAAAPAARGLGGPGVPPGPGLGVRPLGGPSAMAELSARPPPSPLPAPPPPAVTASGHAAS